VNEGFLIEPARTEEFSLAAYRPAYSDISGALFENAFGAVLWNWQTDLAACVYPSRDAGIALPD